MKYLILALLLFMGCGGGVSLNDQQAYDMLKGEIGADKMARLRAELYLNPEMTIEEMEAIIGEDVVSVIEANDALTEWGKKGEDCKKGPTGDTEGPNI